MPDKTSELVDDGLFTPDVGSWGEQKYSLVQNYAQMFTTSMKGKWHLVYIDLFAGSGRARIKESGRIVNASPLLALDVKNRFDRYIFCEENSTKIDALKERVSMLILKLTPFSYLKMLTSRLIKFYARFLNIGLILKSLAFVLRIRISLII